VAKTAPRLLAIDGVGTDVAGILLVAGGDNPDRLRDEGAFAHQCGVAPLPASSGRTVRHRLNRGGDRQANHALWRIVMVRMSYDPQTKAYVARRTTEGLSKREIVRCLKRYVAREVYGALLADLTRPSSDPTRRAADASPPSRVEPVSDTYRIAPRCPRPLRRGHAHPADAARRPGPEPS
jgi:hypothetical protein